ncbi:hypothetical protein CEUSTIGMA_g2454.t1 [Chlamydomonas eustigma]|uniref:Uncharacterized protein n=1 Tax=Chlamydomonas eustigma TaxID=1157962 RepID=A0A250WW01_9CHLO|nr:hypothetical protein CEUSTIGMA_g2454.t1 [Chlamydomonas eustigma]|eukprot:GAX75008.1 hypothetical protein CEUSTIGMA_g2454.t1 [Chlamydomonas eustigma]
MVVLCIASELADLHCTAGSKGSDCTMGWEVERIHKSRGANDTNSITTRTSVVPKILHQIWLTWDDEAIPERWRGAPESCKRLHPDYEYHLWSTEDAEQLIATRYPWFLPTYQAYPHFIQRVDAFKYFVLYEFGGIFLDLDVWCIKNLDFLRFDNFTAPKTEPIGVSNDVLAAQPKDPFLHRLVHSLTTWNQWFLIKYTTVMFGTGPMFMTVQYALHSPKSGLAILPQEIYSGRGPQAAFVHLQGNSWHSKDANVVMWADKHKHHILVSVLLLIFSSLGARLFMALCTSGCGSFSHLMKPILSSNSKVNSSSRGIKIEHS